jgi:hypothetical protein
MLQDNNKKLVVIAQRILNTLLFIAVATVNALSAAQLAGFNGPGDISDDNTSWITPAGFAFIIWGIHTL